MNPNIRNIHEQPGYIIVEIDRKHLERLESAEIFISAFFMELQQLQLRL